MRFVVSAFQTNLSKERPAVQSHRSEVHVPSSFLTRTSPLLLSRVTV